VIKATGREGDILPAGRAVDRVYDYATFSRIYFFTDHT
jgi:hypothetical protein